jgi:hypothetical protein
LWSGWGWSFVLPSTELKRTWMRKEGGWRAVVVVCIDFGCFVWDNWQLSLVAVVCGVECFGCWVVRAKGCARWNYNGVVSEILPRMEDTALSPP